MSTTGRVQALIQQYQLQAHPEGGWYREIFRSPAQVDPRDGRGLRSALTTIDFLLGPCQRSAWHRVASDEAWHLLEGGPLRLWVVDQAGAWLDSHLLQAGAGARAVVPAGAWQAAEPVGGYAFVGATVGPGFEFADFAFGRDHPPLVEVLERLMPELKRLL
jgi:uncharacterized protein